MTLRNWLFILLIVGGGTWVVLEKPQLLNLPFLLSEPTLTQAQKAYLANPNIEDVKIVKFAQDSVNTAFNLTTETQAQIIAAASPSLFTRDATDDYDRALRQLGALPFLEVGDRAQKMAIEGVADITTQNIVNDVQRWQVIVPVQVTLTDNGQSVGEPSHWLVRLQIVPSVQAQHRQALAIASLIVSPAIEH